MAREGWAVPRGLLAAENLVRLGAERLTDILLELAGEHPAIKRRLRLELAGEAGGEAIAAEVAKRITALRSARTFIDWQKRPGFVRDLDLTRAMIADRVGKCPSSNALGQRRRGLNGGTGSSGWRG